MPQPVPLQLYPGSSRVLLTLLLHLVVAGAGEVRAQEPGYPGCLFPGAVLPGTFDTSWREAARAGWQAVEPALIGSPTVAERAAEVAGGAEGVAALGRLVEWLAAFPPCPGLAPLCPWPAAVGSTLESGCGDEAALAGLLVAMGRSLGVRHLHLALVGSSAPVLGSPAGPELDRVMAVLTAADGTVIIADPASGRFGPPQEFEDLAAFLPLMPAGALRPVLARAPSSSRVEVTVMRELSAEGGETGTIEILSEGLWTGLLARRWRDREGGSGQLRELVRSYRNLETGGGGLERVEVCGEGGRCRSWRFTYEAPGGFAPAPLSSFALAVTGLSDVFLGTPPAVSAGLPGGAVSWIWREEVAFPWPICLESFPDWGAGGGFRASVETAGQRLVFELRGESASAGGDETGLPSALQPGQIGGKIGVRELTPGGRCPPRTYGPEGR